MDQSSKEKLVDTFLTPGITALTAGIASKVVLGEDGVLPMFGMQVPGFLGFAGTAFVASLVGNALSSYALSAIPGNYQTLNVERGLVVPTLTGLGEVAIGFATIPTFTSAAGLRLFGLGFGSEVVGQYTENMVRPLLVDASAE